MPPKPSRYYEVGRFLEIPMAKTIDAKIWEKKFIADFTGITRWTKPDLPLTKQDLTAIAERIVRQQRIGVVGLR